MLQHSAGCELYRRHRVWRGSLLTSNTGNMRHSYLDSDLIYVLVIYTFNHIGEMFKPGEFYSCFGKVNLHLPGRQGILGIFKHLDWLWVSPASVRRMESETNYCTVFDEKVNTREMIGVWLNQDGSSFV